MKDILPDIERWQAQGETIAIATVVQTWGSSPRRTGAKMAVSAGGQISGSVSGGCVEGAVIKAAHDVIKTGQPQYLQFGVSQDAAWDVGLACGGTIEVFVQRLDAAYLDTARAAIQAERAFVTATITSGAAAGQQMCIDEAGTMSGSLGAALDKIALTAASSALQTGESAHLTLEAEQTSVFLDVHLPPLELVMVGGVHIAVVLAQLAGVMGYRTIVIDPRSVFSTGDRFPHVGQLFQTWPDKAFSQIQLSCRSAVVMLTHDPKIDDPALKIALLSPAFYVGALGSRKTQAERRQRLLDAGIAEGAFARLYGPVGLDIGGRTPEEIALAIMAEIVAVYNQKPTR